MIKKTYKIFIIFGIILIFSIFTWFIIVFIETANVSKEFSNTNILTNIVANNLLDNFYRTGVCEIDFERLKKDTGEQFMIKDKAIYNEYGMKYDICIVNSNNTLRIEVKSRMPVVFYKENERIIEKKASYNLKD